MAQISLVTIGQLSKQTGVNAETIRYYEKISLLPPPARTQAGYRQYGESHVQQLLFIRRGRDLGFSVDAIRALLTLAKRPDLSCANVDLLVVNHLAEVEKKIDDLIGLRDELRQMINCCGRVVAECRVMDSIASGCVAPNRKAVDCGELKEIRNV